MEWSVPIDDTDSNVFGMTQLMLKAACFVVHLVERGILHAGAWGRIGFKDVPFSIALWYVRVQLIIGRFRCVQIFSKLFDIL